MRYSDFETVMSAPRLNRYRTACAGNTRKAMTLYRLNLRLSQELFTVESCFEVALRNAIDRHYVAIHGAHWLRDAAATGGMFDNHACRFTKRIINDAFSALGAHYTHAKLVAKMDFGFWRYQFSSAQYRAAGASLLNIFPAKPTSTLTVHYNQAYVFNELAKVNDLRNRIAHHEPICFQHNGGATIDTTYASQHYRLILDLFNWMQIDEGDLLYGLDHVNNVITDINNL